MKKLVFLSFLILTCVAVFYLISCTNSKSRKGDEQVSYNFQVRPILSDKCFNCHGPDANKRQAGLRLDIAEEAYKALQEHPRAHAIVPGKPEESELFLRVSSTRYRIPYAPGCQVICQHCQRKKLR